MKKKYFVWSCVVMTFFSACQQAENVNQQVGELPMSIVASISAQKNIPNSRYAGTDPNNVVFKESDRIGVFVDNGSVSEWVYSASEWNSTTTVYWPDKINPHTFCAFYPYDEDDVSITAVPMPSLLNQTGTIESISQCDFLVSSVTQSYGDDGVVKFQGDGAFSHVSSLLQLTFKGVEDLSSSVLKKIKIEGENIVAPTTFSFNDKKVSVLSSDDSDVLEVSLSHEMDGENVTYYFILNEKLDASSVVTLTVEYTTGDKTYVAQKKGFAGNVFAGGVCQSYIMTIMDRLLVISGSSISEWGDGESLDDVVLDGKEKS